ncbi:MAG: AAA family ATPase [Verrucomicrobiia bacterium]
MNTLHIIAGLPASGKTTYGKTVAVRLSAAFLDIDTVTEPVVKAGLQLSGYDPDDRDSPLFKETFRTPIYEALFQIAQENLRHIDVVLVGPFTSEMQNADWPKTLEERFQASIEIHYVSCQPEQRRIRMQQRNHPRDQAKLADWTKHVVYYPNELRPAFEHRFVDTSDSA